MKQEEYDRSYQPISLSEVYKQETLEEAAKEYMKGWGGITNSENSFIEGAKWQQEQDKNKFSEEEVKTKYFIQLERTIYSPFFGKYTEIIKGIYELTDEEVSEIDGKILIIQKMV